MGISYHLTIPVTKAKPHRRNLSVCIGARNHLHRGFLEMHLPAKVNFGS